MAHPGSLRASAVSFASTSATSASCPTFATHVTARTTISLAPRSAAERLQLRRERIHKNRFLAPRPGRYHPDLRARFLLDAINILPCRFPKFTQLRHAL